MEELKACPMCKGEGNIIHNMHDENYYVICSDCRTHTVPFDTEDEAVTQWNNRPIEDRLRTELKESKDGVSAAIRIIHEEDDYDGGMALLCHIIGIKVNNCEITPTTIAELSEQGEAQSKLDFLLEDRSLNEFWERWEEHKAITEAEVKMPTIRKGK